MNTTTKPTAQAEATAREIFDLMYAEAKYISITYYDEDLESFRFQRALWEAGFLRMLAIVTTLSPESLEEFKRQHEQREQEATRQMAQRRNA